MTQEYIPPYSPPSRELPGFASVPNQFHMVDLELSKRLKSAVLSLNRQLAELYSIGLVTEFKLILDGDNNVLRLTAPTVFRTFDSPQEEST